MNNEFDKYLGIANHDIQMANTNQELKSYVASILYDNDKKDKEIDRLNEELGDANYTITQLHKVMDRHYVKKEDYDRLNNIINELEKYIMEEIDCYDVVGVATRLLDKLKKLKEEL